MEKDVVVYSKWYGKLATVLFYVAIVFSPTCKTVQFNWFFGANLTFYYIV